MRQQVRCSHLRITNHQALTGVCVAAERVAKQQQRAREAAEREVQVKQRNVNQWSPRQAKVNSQFLTFESQVADACFPQEMETSCVNCAVPFSRDDTWRAGHPVLAVAAHACSVPVRSVYRLSTPVLDGVGVVVLCVFR